MSRAAGLQRRWHQLRNWPSGESGAILYFPVFGPRARSIFSPPPDFSDLDGGELEERRAGRWGLVASLLLHAIVIALCASAWDEPERQEPPPKARDGVTVTLVSDIPGSIKPAVGRSAVAGAGQQPGLASTRGAAVPTTSLSASADDPQNVPVPQSPEATSPTTAPVSSAPSPPAKGSQQSDAAAPQQMRGEVASRAGSAEEGLWEAAILTRLARKKRYPAEALRAGLSDTVMLRVTIDRGGRLLLAEVAKSHGIASLDNEALALAKRASPYPVPPDSVVGDAVPLVVPIEFTVRRDR